MSQAGLAQEVVQPNEADVISEVIAFIETASLKRAHGGAVHRFNQGRASGCVEAEITVSPDLAPELQVGFFAVPATYQAFIRFANASSSSDRDKDVRGMSIAVSGVSGDNSTPGATRQDFVLNSHPVMVAPDTKEFLALLRANEEGGLARVLYFAKHPASAKIGLDAQGHPTCHLDIPYWSTTPYLFGPGRAVKYVVRPCSERTSPMPAHRTDTYLHDALRAHLAESDACFELAVQFQIDPLRMPIEDATVEWREEDSPYRPVARIRIPRQEIDGPERIRAGEAMAFNPWHCLSEHRPLGNMNRARKEIYEAVSRFRAGQRG